MKPANKAAMAAAKPPVIVPPCRLKTSQNTPTSMMRAKILPEISLLNIDAMPMKMTTP